MLYSISMLPYQRAVHKRRKGGGKGCLTTPGIRMKCYPSSGKELPLFVSGGTSESFGTAHGVMYLKSSPHKTKLLKILTKQCWPPA